MKIPELLSPAGDPEKLNKAILYGADAVYLAGTRFGMRAAASNFSDNQLSEAVRFCHERGKKVYVTCNTIPNPEEIALLPSFLCYLEEINADAIIAADLGVISLCKKYAPSVDLHVSTQAGVMNARTADAFCSLGARRVVLARELSLEEIKRIRKDTSSELEIEVFCHGSMCVSFSGRCLLSKYMTGRDANSGDCTQPCRWKYHLVEEKRPGQYFEISEDNGTYIMNSKDLCTLPILRELIETGIDSLKIEGRTKSSYYTSSVTAAYRHVMNAISRGDPIPESWLNEVEMVNHRPYSTGFYLDSPEQYTNNSAYISQCDVVGTVDKIDKDGNAVVIQKNRFFTGDEVNVLSPDDNEAVFKIGKMLDENGVEIECANHAGMLLRMNIPAGIAPGAFLRKRRIDQKIKNT